ncbi:MAG: DNA methyltransferase, partial [Prevotella sp.]|nr:DNA methyltransferase [Prevotella sp.]
DNCDAIEIPYTDAIPSDYDGIMGVPISFLDKYCPEQFEIVGITKTWFGFANKIYPEQIQVNKDRKKSRVSKLNDGATIILTEKPENETFYIVNGKMFTQVYARVLIRKK